MSACVCFLQSAALAPCHSPVNIPPHSWHLPVKEHTPVSLCPHFSPHEHFKLRSREGKVWQRSQGRRRERLILITGCHSDIQISRVINFRIMLMLFLEVFMSKLLRVCSITYGFYFSSKLVNSMIGGLKKTCWQLLTIECY